ncbi:AraC family transcriptional regulator, partial [Rhizobium ruizarguesonis]
MIDPLSDVFSLLDIESASCTRFEVGGQWAFRFPAKPAL